jgi:hypothetical protein
MRSFRAAWGGRSGTPGARQPDRPQQQLRSGFFQRGVAAAALGGGAAGQLVLSALTRSPWGSRVVAGMVSGGAATAAWSWRDGSEAVAFETAEIPWVQELASQPGMREMLLPGQMLRTHPLGKVISEDDHLVSSGDETATGGRSGGERSCCRGAGATAAGARAACCASAAVHADRCC